MAQAAMFFSPRYNVGEKVAGGTVAIYVDNSQQQLVPLWCYADLATNKVDGSGPISNPVPIDNNGIISSPVFYDASQDTGYVNAYYVLRDAYGAIIRQGFVMPQSWQLTGEPKPPDNTWANHPAGDPYWGYEVIKGTTLVNTPGTIGRPLYYQPASGADRSGGLIVYFVPGNTVSVDNVLSFQGQGGVWVSRDEWINYSYLKAVLPAATEPFAWLNTNYGTGIYAKNMNLDAAPKTNFTSPSTVNFNNKVRILSTVAVPSVGTNNGKVTVNMDEDKLDLLQGGAAFALTAAPAANSIFPLNFNLRGGSVSLLKAGIQVPSNYGNLDTLSCISGILDTVDVSGNPNPAIKFLPGTVIKHMTGTAGIDLTQQTFASQADIWRLEWSAISTATAANAPIGLSGINNIGARAVNIPDGTQIYIDAKGQATAPLFVTTPVAGVPNGAAWIGDTSKSTDADYEPTVIDMPVLADCNPLPGEMSAIQWQYSTSPSSAGAFGVAPATDMFNSSAYTPGIARNSNGAYIATNAIKLSPSKLSTLNAESQLANFPKLSMMNESSTVDMTTNGNMTGATFGFQNSPSLLRNNYANLPLSNWSQPMVMANSKKLDIEGDGRTPIILKSVRKAKKCIFLCEISSGQVYNGLEGLATTWAPWAVTSSPASGDQRRQMDIGADLIEDSIIILDKISYPVTSRIMYRHVFTNTTFRRCVFLGCHSNILLLNCVAEDCSFQNVNTTLTDTNYGNFHVLVSSSTNVTGCYTNGVNWELYGDGDGDNFRDINIDLTSIDAYSSPNVYPNQSPTKSCFLFLWTGGTGCTGTGFESGAQVTTTSHGKFNNKPCILTNVRINSNNSACVKTDTGYPSRIGFNIGAFSNSSLNDNASMSVAQGANVVDQLRSSSNVHSFMRGGAHVTGHWSVSGHNGMATEVFPGNGTNVFEWSDSGKLYAELNIVNGSVQNNSSGTLIQTSMNQVCMPVISESLTYEIAGTTVLLQSDNADLTRYDSIQNNTYPTRNQLRASKWAYWLSPYSCPGVVKLYKSGGSYQTGGN